MFFDADESFDGRMEEFKKLAHKREHDGVIEDVPLDKWCGGSVWLAVPNAMQERLPLLAEYTWEGDLLRELVEDEVVRRSFAAVAAAFADWARANPHAPYEVTVQQFHAIKRRYT